MKHHRPTLADIAGYSEIIDVRSPAEFTEDHIPGARNFPVLDDAQRAQVGTLYKQVSPFEAKKIGAALVSENIARHLRESFLDRPKSWKPLIYCWRGGERSGAMTTIFRSIGWNAGQLDGGYKTYRGHVVERLAELPKQFSFRIISGPTGSAKTRVLQAIGRLGGQVLDLENLACHKGSVLGILPGQPQPAQKWFETLLLQEFSRFDPTRPVFVEAESRKIGRLHVPDTLIECMRLGQCLSIDASLASRVDFLLQDYDYFLKSPELLIQKLDALQGLQSRETLGRWHALASAAEWPELVRELLEQHYDPLYRRSQERHFTPAQHLGHFASDDLSEAGIERLATALLHHRPAQIA